MIAQPLASLLLAAAVAVAAGPALAQAPKAELIGEFADWNAASFDEPAGKGCFIVSAPKKSEGKYSKRDPTYVHVTHRPGVGTRDVVSITAGYVYKPESQVKVTIGNDRFDLFTKEGAAWADDTLDAKLVAAMRKSGRMIVEGVSSRGTATKDTYSLDGFGAAYDAIAKTCPPAP